MATRLPGMYGTVSQDQAIAASKAGPVNPGHGTTPDPSITRGVKGKDAPKYPSPLPVGGLPGFGGGFNPDMTPHTHAAPTAAWAQMDAGTAQAIASGFHAVQFAPPKISTHVQGRQMPSQLVHDVTPGTSVLARDIPRQLRGQSNDIAQGGGVGNDHATYRSANVIRYRRGGWVPTWFVGSAERAIRPNPGQGRNTPVNVDSRYGPGGSLANLNSPNAGPPSPYVAPPNPTIAAGPRRPAGFAW